MSKSANFKQSWILLVALFFIGPPAILNHTGFCYGEMHYLSKREVVDRLLFARQGNKFDGKTNQDRKVKI